MNTSVGTLDRLTEPGAPGPVEVPGPPASPYRMSPEPAVDEETLRMGEMAETTGVSERLLRYYESRGLLTPGRTARGHRFYTSADVARVRLVKFLIDGGMSTKDIRFLLECVHEGVDVSRVCEELDTVLTREYVRISKEIQSLELTRRYLAVLTGRPPGGERRRGAGRRGPAGGGGRGLRTTPA
ncbi:MerR family transcriptional regulator [Streptomyces sp. NPDC017095]|uniref:MerR family transcriptional regulator n=1 Tax=Streptomyces sp. NPDC017095 TaxID=3364977 RepID=UPI0037AB9CD9